MSASVTRRAALALAIAAPMTMAMASCGLAGGGGAASDPSAPLTVLADAEPHRAILQEVEKQGLLGDVKLDVREITGQVDPDQLVQSGDVAANFFQHEPYLKNWNSEHQGTLQSVTSVHVEPLGLYSKKVSSLAQVPQGATIAIPSDATNQARALFLLADAGLVKMDVSPKDPNLDFTKIGKQNVTANPKKVTFREIDRPQLFSSLSDPQITLAIVNGNYALEGGLKPAKDALALEKAEGNPYANVLVTKPEMANDPRVTKLAAALKDPKIRSFITNTYSGSVLPAEN